MKRRRLLVQKPILVVLAVTLVIGLFVFRDYGLTWDEPLFYRYGDALGYAYNPANWISGHFDLNQSYGPSGDDHKNRGPAYLLLAREPVYVVERLGIQAPDAWHLLNFLCFLLGVYFVYKLTERYASPWAAASGAALFAFQPMLWGHAFINPKDMPFLVFFTGSVWLGLRMADCLADSAQVGFVVQLRHVWLPAIVLGLATANRVLGPLAGVLVSIYVLFRLPIRRAAPVIVSYGVISLLVVFATWPYLWEGPARFLDAFQFMSANPTVLPVLFDGQVYRAYDLPRRYMPFFLLTTLTEVVWPLFVVGLLAKARPLFADRRKLLEVILLLGWFGIPLLYVVLARPPIYDGMRHFLFILPPLFVVGALGLDFLFAHLKQAAWRAALVTLLLFPGVAGIVRLHPYEYAYYNSLVGGTAGAFRNYETDYWLTCYKEAVQNFQSQRTASVRLFVHREAEVAAPYASPNVTVLDERGAQSQIRSGDYVLANTRTNEDRQTFHDAPTLLTIERGGAAFCVIKSIP